MKSRFLMNAPELLLKQALSFGLDSFPLTIQLTSSNVEANALFQQMVADNPELVFEQTSSREILVMLPTGGKSGWRSLWIGTELSLWTRQYGGVAFDSSTLFQLPGGAKRSPDCAWVAADRWGLLTEEEQESYPPLSPDFVIELRSKSDRLTALKEKMLDYALNGVRLGWLIDPFEKQVHIYRVDGSIEILNPPLSIEGEDVLPGFVLNLASIWN